MFDKTFLNRTILSENELTQFISEKGEELNSYMDKLSNGEKIYLTNNEIYEFIENLKKDNQKKAQDISSWAISLVRSEENSLQEGSNEFIASVVSKIFKHPNISKNSNSLDISKIEEKCLNFVKNNQTIQLAIGWGQPKRIAGGFKAQGPNADLAELIAISNHIIMINAIENIYSKGAILTLLSGSSRFYESYFMKKELSDLYDEQRRKFVKLLNAENKINISHYEEVFNALDEINQLRETLFNEALEELDADAVNKYLRDISLNIDWNNIFSIEKNNLSFSPHGLSLSSESINYIKSLSKDELNKLIRHSLICIFNEELIGKYEVEHGVEFNEICSFMEDVSFISAKKYIATHYKDKSCQINVIMSHINSEAIRLTVHEKKDRNDIPAIYTLGKKGRNKLAQHTSIMIDEHDELVFCSTVEALSLGGIPVYPPKDFNIGQNETMEQPMFYTIKKEFKPKF